MTNRYRIVTKNTNYLLTQHEDGTITAQATTPPHRPESLSASFQTPVTVKLREWPPLCGVYCIMAKAGEDWPFLDSDYMTTTRVQEVWPISAEEYEIGLVDNDTN